MPENEQLVQCYNRGCGKLFDPNNNDKDECCHHPGAPVFHDAYKGWSCCNKKSVDFTEFLNIKGCTMSKHSNVKPPEPEKKALDKELDKKEVIVVRAPVLGPQLSRPPYDSPLVTLEAHIAESLKEYVNKTPVKSEKLDSTIVEIGTSCKNGGCSQCYEGPDSNNSICTYHPGCPVFHEGLKFWSCCTKRTTDFNTFLSQPGCTTGSHKWIKETAQCAYASSVIYMGGEPYGSNEIVDEMKMKSTGAGNVKCRWDWHQTPDYVIVSVYAKKYNPTESFVKLNPIRMHTKLVFQEEGNGVFELDLELRGVIDVNKSTASMMGTKIEIKLKKAEPGAWSKLDFPREQPKPKVEEQPLEKVEDDSVDLSTVEAIHSMGRVNVTG